MQTNLLGYQSPLHHQRHRLPYISESTRSSPIVQIVQPIDQKLHSLMQNAHEVLAKADTLFPFTIFPDSIIVDRSKVTIIRRTFFRMAETFSIRIEDILNVTTTVGPFLGSIQIISRVFNTDKPHHVNFLKRSDAIRLKHITQGYVIAAHNDVDCASMEKNTLITTLARLGHDAST